MKNWLWIPLAAVIGVVAGSWGPRADIKLLKERMQQERMAKRQSASAGFDAFAHLTGIPDVAKSRAPDKGEKARVANGEKSVTNAVAKAAPPKPMSGKERAKERFHREDLRERINEAAELWKVRVDLATSQWKERLGIKNGTGADAFDSSIAEMNDELRELMQTMADEIEASGKMTPELALRLMGDATRIMAETYDSIGEALPEATRATVSEMPVFEFIDPTVAEPLISVQDKLDDAPLGRPRP